MTPGGYTALREELHRVKFVERPQNIRDIEEARSHGDISENAEFEAAKERQAFLDGRIRELESKIAMAQVIDPSTLSGKSIVFGATVVMMDVETDEELKYQIVGVDEADVKAGRISVKSPIARALLGKKVDDTVRVNVPKGVRELQILRIEFV